MFRLCALSLLTVASLAITETDALAQCRCCFNLPSCSCEQCNHQDDCKDCCRGCCKVKIKRSYIGCQPPASGIVVSSVPAITVSAPAVPIQFGSSGVSASELLSLMQSMNAMNSANAGVNSAATKQTCEDPCGSIKQLEHDVAELQQTTRNLMDAVEVMIDRLEKLE